MKLFVVLSMAFALSAGSVQLFAQTDVKYPDGFPDRGKEVLQNDYSDATITFIGKGGKAKLGDVYYVNGTINGKRLEMIMTKEGEVHEELHVSDVALTDVPAVCIEAAQKVVDEAPIVSAEIVERGDAIEYRLKSEFIAEPDDPGVGSKAVVLVSPEGKVIQNMRVHRVGESF